MTHCKGLSITYPTICHKIDPDIVFIKFTATGLKKEHAICLCLKRVNKINKKSDWSQPGFVNKAHVASLHINISNTFSPLLSYRCSQSCTRECKLKKTTKKIKNENK